jgi:hypothetical protein
MRLNEDRCQRKLLGGLMSQEQLSSFNKSPCRGPHGYADMDIPMNISVLLKFHGYSHKRAYVLRLPYSTLSKLNKILCLRWTVDPYSLLKNSSIKISSIGLLEQCSLLQYLIILFFGRSGMIFLSFFASTDLRAHFLAVWTKNLSRLVHN